MKKIGLLFYFFCHLSLAFAQKINVDSLVRVAVVRNSKSGNISAPNRDSLLKLIPITSSPAMRIKLIYDILENYGQLDEKRQLYYDNRILELAAKNNDKISQAVILSELGFDIFHNGGNNEGLQMIFKGLRLAEQTGNDQATGVVYDNLAVCYPDNDLLKKFYLQKAIKFSGAGNDTTFLCYELGNLSNVYKKEKKTDSAEYYLLRSFDLAVRKNLEQALSYSVIMLGSLQNNANNKLKFYKAALNMPYTKRDTPTFCTALKEIASFYQQQGQTDSGLFYAKKAFAFSSKIQLSLKIEPAYLLAQLYKGKNADSALKYTEIYFARRDSMYSINKIEQAQALAFTNQQRQRELDDQKAAYQTNLRLYIFLVIVAFLIFLALVFWRNNRQNKRSNLQLQYQKQQIQNTLNELKATQNQLIQSEKMASLGELTAGIAHEIQNPLNFVNNFSEVSVELLGELKEEAEAGNKQDVIAIADDLTQNLEKIRHHGKRADAIVKGMLQHSQSGSGAKEPTNINALADEYLRLSYHGLRSKDKNFNAEMVTNFDEKLPLINVMPQDIGRVMLNLFNNAFYAVNQKQKKTGEDYKPEVSVTTSLKNGQVVIQVKDNGIGIPDAIKEKIMQPFFTTKPTGEGTGLGLSLTYDMVVKGHGGKIEVNSKEGEGSELIISLPDN